MSVEVEVPVVSQWGRPSSRELVWLGVAFVGVYGLLQPLGRLFVTPMEISVWFPPAALTLVWLFFAPPVVGLAVAIGGRSLWSLLLGPGNPPGVVVGSAALVTLAYLAAAQAYRRWMTPPADPAVLGRGHVAGFVLLGAGLGPALAAVAARTFVALTRGTGWDGWGGSVYEFWVGDAVAVMTLVPLAWALAMLWRSPPGIRAVTELVLGSLLTALVGWYVLLIPASPLYLALVPVVVLVFRHALVGAAIGSAAAGLAMAATLALSNEPSATVSATHAFLVVLAIMAATVGVAELAQRTATEDLRQSEERFRQMVQAVEDHAIYRLDPDGRIATWNEGAERLAGWSTAEVLGRHLGVLYGDDEAARDRADRQLEAARTSGHVQDEGWVMRRDGTWFWAATSLTRLTDDAGAVRGFTDVTRDLTAQREAGAQLELRTRQLEISNEELDRFASVASHDLQEPLRMVSAHTELLARHYGDRIGDEGRELVGFAVDGARRMRELIDDLLAYSRLHTRPETRTRVDLGTVMEGVQQDLALAIADTGARIEVGELPQVVAAPVGMRMLLQNLVGNALKYHGEAPPAVRVTARRRDRDTWEIAVRDNGIGIPPERRAVIFEPFRRLHGRGEYRGTGVGLAICRRIVTQHGGEIWVEGTEGPGSIFRFTLPETSTPMPTGGTP